MIKILQYGEVPNSEIFARFNPTASVSDIVAEILAEVAKNGDKALKAFAQKFDGVTLDSLEVPKAEIEKAAKKAGSWGVLGTLWNHFNGYNMSIAYCNVASMSWNPDAEPSKYGHYSAFKTHTREVNWDMKLKKYRQSGLNHFQVPYNNMPNPEK